MTDDKDKTQTTEPTKGLEPLNDQEATQSTVPMQTRQQPPMQHQPVKSVPPPPPASIPQAKPAQSQRPTGNPPPRAARPAPKGTARHRRDNALYLPLWSIILMLFSVFSIAAVIVFIVIAAGQRENMPQGQAIVIISSPIPTQAGQIPISPATATLPPEADQGIITVPPTFALSGPTLVAVELSPTPKTITVGEQVIVIDVGIQKLNVRDTPGVVGTNIVFRADEGSIMKVIGGPQQADGLTWWEIQDTINPQLSGWAASNYLQVTP